MESITASRLEGEGEKAYAAFQLYCEMGDKRTHKAVGKKLRKSRILISRWASKFSWKDRIVSYHQEASERDRAALEKAALEKARERLERQNQVQDSAWELFQTIRAKVVDMLKFPVARQTVTSDEKGKTTTTIIEPAKWRFADVANLAQTADQLARLATGMTTSNGKLALSDPNGAPLPAPVQTLIQISISRAADAKSTHEYKMLKGDEEEDENALALEA